MFKGFSDKTGGFLWELAFHNERPWFLEHKQMFEDEVNTPLKALAQDSLAALSLRSPGREWRAHVSRIYRDARRLFGRGPYKERLWFSVWGAEATGEAPMYWFELGPADYAYGLGWYGASPAQMELFRRQIDANPARFLRLARKVGRDGWILGGEPYKRPKGRHDDALLDDWFNRRYVGVEKRFDLGGTAYTPALPEALADEWAALLPLYDFLREVYLQSPEDPGRFR